jgi:hypothetical protein
MIKQILLLAVAFSNSILISQNGASVDYKITSSKGANGEVKVKFSEFGSISEFNMVIPQMPGGGMFIKSLTKKSTPGITYMINDKNKIYSQTNPTDPSNQDTKTYVVKKLGEETINGYKCMHALVTEGTETHEVWNTKDIADYAKYSEAFRANKKIGSQKREDALRNAGCDGLPVKTLHKGNEREGDMTMELVKLEKKTFNKSEFEIPDGYTMTAASNTMTGGDSKSPDELKKMTPEERAKYIEEMKKKYGAK